MAVFWHYIIDTIVHVKKKYMVHERMAQAIKICIIHC